MFHFRGFRKILFFRFSRFSWGRHIKTSGEFFVWMVVIPVAILIVFIHVQRIMRSFIHRFIIVFIHRRSPPVFTMRCMVIFIRCLPSTFSKVEMSRWLRILATLSDEFDKG